MAIKMIPFLVFFALKIKMNEDKKLSLRKELHSLLISAGKTFVSDEDLFRDYRYGT